MSDALHATFRLLGETPNEAAVAVLLPALDSPYPVIRDQALAALFARRGPRGMHEVLQRLDRFEEPQRSLVERYGHRLTGALRDAILGADAELCCKACETAMWLKQYELVPSLLGAVEKAPKQNADLLCRSVAALAVSLREQLSAADNEEATRQATLTRRGMCSALELALKRLALHHRRPIVEAFLLLADRRNEFLLTVLENPHNPLFVAVVDVLARSEQEGVRQLLLSFLDDPDTPSAPLSVLANRCDARCVEQVLSRIGAEPTAAVKTNLKRMENVSWFKSNSGILSQLNETQQQAVIQVVVHGGMPRSQSFALVEQLVLHGELGARRDAVQALAGFQGADANNLALHALKDADPQIQAGAILQLRQRGIPGVLARIVGMVDSRHAVVRAAARQALGEFSFPRFLQAFDMLDDEVRRSTGMLVKKLDPEATTQLRRELQSSIRSRRLRGLAIAKTMQLVNELAVDIIRMASEDDNVVRTEAVHALGSCRSSAARPALEQALLTVFPPSRKQHGNRSRSSMYVCLGHD